MQSVPKVSIGIPAYNAERYLAACIECYLNQSFRDLEVIISDNGSTDGTRAICEAYAAKDPRVHYHRQESNQGAAWNFNRVLELARGPFFKWAAYDDYVDPRFVEVCLADLESRPRDIISFGITVLIDADGKETSRYPEPMRIDSPRPSERLYEYFKKVGRTHALYGIIRADVLRATGGLGHFATSDFVLLAELALRGTFHEVPEALFYRRIHESAYASNLTWSAKAAWFDPKNAGKLALPAWQHFAAYLASIGRVPMRGWDRVKCYAVFLQRERYEIGELSKQAIIALRVKLFGFPKEAF